MAPAYRAHPEFGYFCPSRGFRRKLLAALAVIGLGALASAVVVGGSRESRDDASPPPAPINAASSNAATPPGVDQATATAARPGPTEGHRPVCEGETWTYLDGKCITDKAQKRIAAIDSPPIAAIPLGRTAPPPAAAQPPAKSERASEAAAAPPASKSERASEAAAAPPASKSERVAETAATEPAATATPAAAAEPAVQSTSASKERRKVARERASRDERRSARTAASDNRKPKSATGWTKQVRSAEQFVRALFTPGI